MLDLDCAWQDMGKARDLARRHEDVTVVLEHIGYPRDTNDPGLLRRLALRHQPLWHRLRTCSARSPGSGMNRAGWTVDGLRPWVEHCIEQFGPQRCLFGTNWPVDRLWASYGDYVDAFETLIGAFSPEEQDAMLTGNARATYRWPAD